MNEAESGQRVPPQNLLAEQSVLASMLLSADVTNRLAESLTEDDFYRNRHRIIFQQILELRDREEPVDLITLSEALRTTKKLDEVGGMPYLTELFSVTPTTANADYYAEILKKKAQARQLIEVGSEIVRRSFDEEADIDALLDFSEKEILAAARQRQTQPYHSMKDLVGDTFELIDKIAESKERISGIPTGFPELDKYTTGLQPSDLIVLAARPSMGKTSFALDLMSNAAIRARKAVLFFSLEMYRTQLVMRLLCSRGRVDSSRVRSGFISQNDRAQLVRAAGELMGSPMFIDDSSEITIREIRSKARACASQVELGMIIIDYLQLITSVQSRAENRQQEISQISRQLKGLARELNIPVVALSQLSRRVESREDKRPILSDLRESGAIEQDADLVLFLYRDEVYNKNSKDKGLAEVIIGKQRNGPLGTVKASFLKSYTSFKPYTAQSEDD